jgi:hypothetical protein
MEEVLPLKRTSIGTVNFGMTSSNPQILHSVICPYTGNVTPPEAKIYSLPFRVTLFHVCDGKGLQWVDILDDETSNVISTHLQNIVETIPYKSREVTDMSTDFTNFSNVEKHTFGPTWTLSNVELHGPCQMWMR